MGEPSFENNLMDDVFNNENESFSAGNTSPDQRTLCKSAHALLLSQAMEQRLINVVNPFRAAIVLGTPGSGKSYAVVNNFIKQQIEKGYSMYIYDFKFPRPFDHCLQTIC